MYYNPKALLDILYQGVPIICNSFLWNFSAFIFDVLSSKYFIQIRSIKVCENSVLLVFCPYYIYLRINFIIILYKFKTDIANKRIFFKTVFYFDYTMTIFTSLINFFVVISKHQFRCIQVNVHTFLSAYTMIINKIFLT